MTTSNIPTSGLADFITDLAQKYGIQYARTPNDALADVITRLADDVIVPDETENLVVALKRAHVIDGQTMVTLLGNYFDELKHIQAVQRLQHVRSVQRL